MISGILGVGGHHLAVTDGFGRGHLGVHRVRIEPLGHQPDTPPGVAETPAQFADGQPAHVAAGMYAALRQKATDAVGDAAEFGDRQRGQGGAGLGRRDDGQTIGFVSLGGIFGGGLVAAQPHRAEHPAGGLQYGLFDPSGDPFRRSQQTLAMGDVQKGLVHREDLQVRGDVGERRHDVRGDPGVALRVGRHLNEAGTDALRLFEAHAGAHPVGAGLVGAGDDAGALGAVGDADGTALPLRVVDLLNAAEEGVHVHQDDGAGPGGGFL